MKKVYQTIVDRDYGNCLPACAASILELKLEDVPDFNSYGDSWFLTLYDFFYSKGYKCEGNGRLHKRKLKLEDSIDGYFIGIVRSSLFKDRNHTVILNINGYVVHDPNPNNYYLGLNIYNKDWFKSWFMFETLNNKLSIL